MLLNLHAWSRLRENPSDEPVLPDTAQALLTLHGTRNGRDKWIQWKNDQLNRCRNNGGWKNQADLLVMTLEPPTDNDLARVTKAINAELRLGGHSLHLGTAAKTCRYGTRADKFCNWLDGEWLESALLKALKNLSGALKLHDVKMNVTPEIPTGTHFQYDVVAIHGYQLFAFSCSTAGDEAGDRGRLKRKLFEAAIRARQMGGDEACVALVCCSNDPEGLQEEVRNIFLDTAGDERIKVFGRKHLAALEERTRDWIKKQSCT